MRILFVCSSLEPARDGVGDYVRRLAEECTRAGHACAMLALHDRCVAAADSPAASATGEIPCLRLSAEIGWPKRLAAAATFRETFQPDWISVQFVPYAFEDRGLVFGLGAALKKLSGAVPVHLMFHELWIGAARGASLRHRLVGMAQRFAIRRMIARLQPRLITTTIPIYVAMLEKIGVRAGMLPLFGNVPITPPDRLTALPETIIDPQRRADGWVGVFFGALHPEWEPEPLFSILQRRAQEAGEKLRLVQAGRAGAAGEALWSRLEQEYAGVIDFVRWGEQPAELISTLFQAADFGIAASPWNLIGKSGSAAAMREHGLPVIVTRDDYQVRGIAGLVTATDPLFIRVHADYQESIPLPWPRGPLHARLPEIAHDFYAALHRADSAGDAPQNLVNVESAA